MASPAHSSHSGSRVAYSQRLRRSSFNGAKQLQAAQAPNRRMLVLMGALLLALVAAVGTIAFHFVGSH